MRGRVRKIREDLLLNCYVESEFLFFVFAHFEFCSPQSKDFLCTSQQRVAVAERLGLVESIFATVLLKAQYVSVFILEASVRRLG